MSESCVRDVGMKRLVTVHGGICVCLTLQTGQGKEQGLSVQELVFTLLLSWPNLPNVEKIWGEWDLGEGHWP